MKNLFIFSVIILVLVMAGACAGAPPPTPPVEQTAAPVAETPPPALPPPTVQQPPVEPARDPYERHASGIILNGATPYTVARGDTLARIAQRLYGDGSYYPLIMMVSDDTVTDPDRILPGTHLIIPALTENLNDPRARESMNRFFLQIAGIEDQRGRPQTAALIRSHAN